MAQNIRDWTRTAGFEEVQINSLSSVCRELFMAHSLRAHDRLRLKRRLLGLAAYCIGGAVNNLEIVI
jgi:hypothetical protein